MNVIVKLNVQSQACLDFAIARIENRGAKATQLKIEERKRLKTTNFSERFR